MMTELGIMSVHAKSANKKFQSFVDTFGLTDDDARLKLAQINKWKLTFDIFVSHEEMERVFKLVKNKTTLPKSFDKLDTSDFPTEKVAKFTDQMSVTEKLLTLVGKNVENVENSDDVDNS